MMKLLLNWDIKPGRDQEYFEFMVREFAPGINRLGLNPTEAWLAVYGDCPQIMMEAVGDNMQAIRDLLEDPEWIELRDKLMEYVENYEHKIVPASKGFQI